MMKLTETQACDIWRTALFPLNQRQSRELLWGTDRMQRRALHVLHRAEKKRAKRGKSVRPIVRLTTASFTPKGKWRAPFTLVISVGNDAEIYENERMLREAEAQELREDDWYDFLSEEAADCDAEQVLLDDEPSGDDPVDHDDLGDTLLDDLSHDDGF